MASSAGTGATEPLSPDSFRAALESAVAESRAPGAVALVGDADGVRFHAAVGYRQTVPDRRPAQPDTIYDLASLTKVVATTTAVLMLRDDGVWDLDQPVADFVPVPAFRRFTLRHLLTHTSGLVAGKPYYRECHSLDEMLARIAELEPEWTPGTRRRYSDLGFIILGRAVELAARDSLDAFSRKRIFAPLGMTRTTYNPPADWAADCAATEDCPWRGHVMLGAVHDENAYAVGGVSGHAGLFSTAEDLARFCRALLGGRLVKRETLEEATRIGQVPVWPYQGLGWLLDSWTGDARYDSCQGFLPARAAFGHTGWTGTSLWMDRDRGLYAILLGNTCHPSRKDRDNDTFRRTFYTAVARRHYTGHFATHTGLARLIYQDFSPLRGKRIALLTHRAAVDQQGRHILDVLALAPDINLQTIYSPEHGLWGNAEAGEKVTGPQRAPAPVVSLYGERRAPDPAELDGLDYFVVDLQDVGSRYYTYIATVKDCLAVCARTGTTVLVLDRPNPLGGEILEGPMALKTGSPVCCAPFPVRHGMTLGETALYFLENDFAGTPLQVVVITLDAWPRDQLFGVCDLPWVPPSPNIPTWETALAYVGTCLFEGVNLNEGRGTDTPFLVVGAPWLDAADVIDAIAPEDRPGCRLEPVRYTPRAIPGKASNPVYKDEECRGIRIHIEAPHELRAFRLTVALLSAIRREHPRKLEWKPFFDTLAGSDDLRRRIEAGEPTTQIVADYERALRAFDAARPRRYS